MIKMLTGFSLVESFELAFKYRNYFVWMGFQFYRIMVTLDVGGYSMH